MRMRMLALLTPYSVVFALVIIVWLQFVAISTGGDDSLLSPVQTDLKLKV